MRLTGRLRDLDDEGDLGAAVAEHILREAREQSEELADAIEALTERSTRTLSDDRSPADPYRARA